MGYEGRFKDEKGTGARFNKVESSDVWQQELSRSLFRKESS
jgi:hypothetical protein